MIKQKVVQVDQIWSSCLPKAHPKPNNSMHLSNSILYHYTYTPHYICTYSHTHLHHQKTNIFSLTLKHKHPNGQYQAIHFYNSQNHILHLFTNHFSTIFEWGPHPSRYDGRRRNIRGTTSDQSTWYKRSSRRD